MPAIGLADTVRRLNPAYFALVMATGIVSISAEINDMPLLARGLLALNVAAYLALVGMVIARAILFTPALLADVSDHGRGPGFFTFVAGSGVLGIQFVLIVRVPVIAVGLWILTIGLWLVTTYSIFIALSIKRTKPGLEKGINGGWLVAIVAIQSVSILSTLTAPLLSAWRDQILFLALSTWLFGGMLYIWIISLIFYRYTFLKFVPADLSPPYWINMGAMAISTLAGAILLRDASQYAPVTDCEPFIRGLTLLFWATGTWWIPILLLLGIWRYGVSRFPLAYDPLYWGMVFPLGMYAVCTDRLALVLHLSFLQVIPHAFNYVALVAWSAVFLGWLIQALIPASASLVEGKAPSRKTRL